MCVLNGIDRFTLVLETVRRTPKLAAHIAEAEQLHSEKMQEHRLYVSEHGEDLPDVRNWTWSSDGKAGGAGQDTGGDNA